jgi:hypothetical protein
MRHQVFYCHPCLTEMELVPNTGASVWSGKCSLCNGKTDLFCRDDCNILPLKELRTLIRGSASCLEGVK